MHDMLSGQSRVFSVYIADQNNDDCVHFFINKNKNSSYLRCYNWLHQNFCIHVYLTQYTVVLHGLLRPYKLETFLLEVWIKCRHHDG